MRYNFEVHIFNNTYYLVPKKFSTMEFCPQLSAFQGLIISADNVHPFSRLTSKGGNEEKIQYVIDTITKFLEDGRYSTENGVIEASIPKVRKFAFFIILNSDLSVLSDMTDLEEIELVIWTIPTIPKCLMCELFWRLKFDQFVYEVIAYSHPELASEIASAFIDNIKYYTPSECLTKINIISSALYKLICRIYLFNFYQNTLADKLTMLFSNLQKTINFFTEPPRQERLNSLSKDDQYKYIGKCLNTMLLLVHECMEEFMGLQELGRVSDPIYTLTYKASVTNSISCRPCECPSQDVLDCLHKCHTALLDKCQQVVMSVSVDIFCAWSEFEENGKSTQQRIGELCHKVRAKLLTISSVAEHPLLGMLEQISCKPEDLNDVIRNSDMDTIVENINNSENKATWLRALLQKDQLYKDQSLINCVIKNLQLLNEEECYNTYKSVKNFMKENSENRDLDLFVVKLFQHCNLDTKYEILNEIFTNKCFVNMPDTDAFVSMMTEIFNKLIVAPEADLTDILCLFLQNPHKVYTKIFELATENLQQTNIMLKVMKLIERFSSHYYTSDTEPCVIRVTQTSFSQLDSEAKIHNFIKFICALKSSSYITGPKLLLLIIMPNLHKALIDKDIASLDIQCKLLKDAYTLEELMEFRAPLLAMLGQILDTVRWKINTFVPLAPATLQLALDLQMSLFNTYDSGIPENECSWLKSKMRNLHPLNMYYYRKLWNPPGNNIVEVVSGMNVHVGMDMEQLVSWLIQVICSTTQQEWSNIWDGLSMFGDAKILEVFHNSIMLITLTEKAYSSESKWACVLYYYRNFVYMMRYKYFKEPLTDSQVSSVVIRMVVTMQIVPEDRIEDLSTVLLPLFAYFAEKKSQFSFDIAEYLNRKLKNSKFTDILMKVFTDATV